MSATARPAVTARSYTTHAFNSLPDFDDAKSRADDYHAVLDSVGEIIRRHDAQKLLGAALIHKHFPLSDGYRLVEKVEPSRSVLMPSDAYTDDELEPYLWHLSAEGSGSWTWNPVEFVLAESVTDEVREFAQSLKQNQDLLEELAMALSEGEARDTFGLAVLHRQMIEFDRQEQVLLETPGSDEHTLVVTPTDPSQADEDWTQTYWHFDLDDHANLAACSQHACAGYCSLHG